MDYRSPIPHERCAEHDLAVGPAGECVLCRRARARRPTTAGRPRWLAPALLAAGLGTTLLGGVALARTRTPAPVVEAASTEVAAPPIELPPAVAETRPCEPPAAFPPTPAAPLPAPPPPAAKQRNYLEEAYAAMPKGHLYDEPPARQGTTGETASTCPCRTGGCQHRYYLSTRAVPYAPTRVGTSGVQTGTADGQPFRPTSAGPRPGSFNRGSFR
jgi:hypothetical protein